jgi:hypothetical protein
VPPQGRLQLAQETVQLELPKLPLRVPFVQVRVSLVQDPPQGALLDE